jgi:hypothetical protein
MSARQIACDNRWRVVLAVVCPIAPLVAYAVGIVLIHGAIPEVQNYPLLDVQDGLCVYEGNAGNVTTYPVSRAFSDCTESDFEYGRCLCANPTTSRGCNSVCSKSECLTPEDDECNAHAAIRVAFIVFCVVGIFILFFFYGIICDKESTHPCSARAGWSFLIWTCCGRGSRPAWYRVAAAPDVAAPAAEPPSETPPVGKTHDK